jgi:hypothetical protein
MTADRLMNRVLRFISYNFHCYRTHRTDGEYSLAVERLERTRRLIAIARHVQAVRDSQIDAADDNEIKLLERHIDAMFDPAGAAHYSQVLDQIAL